MAATPFYTGLTMHNSLAAVYNNVLRQGAFLQHALLWMVATATEETRRLDTEVPNPLLVTIYVTPAILLNYIFILSFNNLCKVNA